MSKKKQKKCDCQTEVYQRIVGFYRPTRQWNKGKKAEYGDRLNFKLEKDTFDKLDSNKEKLNV